MRLAVPKGRREGTVVGWSRDTDGAPYYEVTVESTKRGGQATTQAGDAPDRAKVRLKHVPWSAVGFLGDELPSEHWPNAALLDKALRDIRPGDILLAHLGIWSRKDPFAPMLDPLIGELQHKGFCFATIPERP